jgi:hypothetical protein
MKLRDHEAKQRWGEATAKLDNDSVKQQPTRVMIGKVTRKESEKEIRCAEAKSRTAKAL